MKYTGGTGGWFPVSGGHGHAVDSSDHQERVPPGLAALDAAMRAGTDAQWFVAAHAHKAETRQAERAAILAEALRLAGPHLAAAEREQAEEKLAAVRSLAEQLGDRTNEPALPAPLVKVHLPLSDRRIVEPIRRRLLEILDGQTGGDQLEGYRPFHGPECPARTSRSADTCTCGGLGKPLWNPGDGPQRPVTP